jgi:hypothetical protein
VLPDDTVEEAMARVTLTTLLALVCATVVLGAEALARVGDAPNADYPQIELWITQRDVLGRGDPVRVWFRSTTDAYVTVFRIDTDGRIRVLFPTEPGDDNSARGGERHETAFVVDDYPGTGYLFAVASLDPLDYGAFVSDERWDFQAVSNNQRVRGDPYVALTDLVERIVPEEYAEWAYDLVPYLVDRRYDSPPSWDPHRDWCGTFRTATLDDPVTYLATGFPAMEPLFWFPPVAAAPVTVSAGSAAPTAPVARAGRQAGSGRSPAPVARPRPSGRGSPPATPRHAVGGGGGVQPGPAARGGQGVAPRERGGSGGRPTAPRSAPRRTTVASGPGPRR